MKSRLKDVLIDHRPMVGYPTSEMRRLAAQIETLQAAYAKLEEVAQRSKLHQYQALLRANGLGAVLR